MEPQLTSPSLLSSNHLLAENRADPKERLTPPSYVSKKNPESPLPYAPSSRFLLLLAALSFFADIGSKFWAESRLEDYRGITVIDHHLSFILAKNRGGAWGMFHDVSENIRRPFFLLVSAVAVTFIVSLYRKILPHQTALKWGLPLVLGGALGNVFDRVRYGYVIDFIDYQAAWVRSLNTLIAKLATSWAVTDHWPTFNVADVFICVGVFLMSIDMFTSRRSIKDLSNLSFAAKGDDTEFKAR